METNYIQFITELKQNILRHRYQAAMQANRQMLLLYYQTGLQLSLKIKTANWGDKIIRNISADLQKEIPGLRGFSYSNLQNMKLFFEEYSFLTKYLSHNTDIQNFIISQMPSVQIENQIVQLLTGKFESTTNQEYEFVQLLTGQLENQFSQLVTGELENLEHVEIKEDIIYGKIEKFVENVFLKIGFTHHILLIQKCKKYEERLFYFEKIIEYQWSVTILEHHLESQLFERQGKIPNNFERTLPSKLLAHATDAFKSEYLLDFINLEDSDDERVLETEIVLNIKKFIMALGNNFTFMGNQFRIVVEEQEFFIDLLFYHRKLQSLIAFELKRGKFKAEYAGKMNLYLSALDEYVKQPHENPSIGIILCKEKTDKIVEFAFRDYNKAMGVATYKTSRKLPVQFEGLLPNADDLRKLL